MRRAQSARTKHEVVKDFRTQEILEAARRVIAAHGWADTSMDRIAQEAGVAKGTLYLYFKSKQSLVARAVEEGLAEVEERARLATQRVRGPTRKLREIVRVGLEDSRENQAFYQALLEQPAGPVVTRKALEQQQGYQAFIAKVLERGVRAGEFRPLDSQRAARFLIDLVTGTALARLEHPEPPPVEADVASTVDFFLHGVGAGDPS